MPSNGINPALLGDLGAYATDVACWRIEAIEKGMRNAPDVFPDYAKARKNIDAETATLIQKLGGDELALEPLMTSRRRWTADGSAMPFYPTNCR